MYREKSNFGNLIATKLFWEYQSKYQNTTITKVKRKIQLRLQESAGEKISPLNYPVTQSSSSTFPSHATSLSHLCIFGHYYCPFSFFLCLFFLEGEKKRERESNGDKKSHGNSVSSISFYCIISVKWVIVLLLHIYNSIVYELAASPDVSILFHLGIYYMKLVI